MGAVNWDGAIQEIERRGRCRYSFVNNAGKVCLLGAAMLGSGVDEVTVRTLDAAKRHPVARAAGEVLAPIIREQFPDRYSHVFDPWTATEVFNDTSKTTDEEILLVLEKARAHEQVA